MGTNLKPTYKSWPAKALNWAAKAVDSALTRSRDQVSSLIAQLKTYGITLFAWAKWSNRKFIKDGYMGNSMVYAVVNRITKKAAIAPFYVYRVKDKRKAFLYKQWTGPDSTKESRQRAMLIKEQAFEEDLEHPFNEILKKPNKWQGWSEFVQTSIGFKLLTGNTFWLKNILDAGANEGKLVSIYNLPPEYTVIVAGGTLWEVIGYELQLGSVVKIPASLVEHSRYWNPEYDTSGSHLWGLAPLTAARKDLDRSNMAAQRGVTMLENAGAAGVLFEKTNAWDALTDEQTGELKRNLNEDILGAGNAGKIALANGDIGYHNFGQTSVEMDVVNQERYSDEKICNVFCAPPGLFMANANATDNNIKAWNKELVSNAVLPALTDIRESLNNVATMSYPDDNIFVDFDKSVYPELQEDMKSMSDWLGKSWWIKGNEKRLAMGYDEDTDEPMMDTYLVPTSVQPINDINPDMLQDEIDRADEEANRQAGS